METKNEIGQEQAKSHPDFVKMLEAFAEIRENLKGFREKLEMTGSNRDLTEQESKKIIEEVIKGKGMKPKNPFLKGDDIEAGDMTETIHDYISFCRTTPDTKTGIRPHYNIEGFQRFMETRAKEQEKSETPDKKFERIAGRVNDAKEDFKESKPKEFYDLIFDILKNKGEGVSSIPDPSRYYWACEQLKNAELKFQIVEENGKQQISFTAKFKGQAERPIKSIDFKQQQNEIAPLSARDITDMHRMHVFSQGQNPDKVENNVSFVEDVAKIGVDGKPITKPPVKVKGSEVDKFNRMNNDSSALFFDIKQKLGYNMQEPAPRSWETCDSSTVTQVIFSLRDTKGLPEQQLENVIGQGAGG
jgi:hypothetical protein